MERKYTKAEFLKAAEIGEVSMIDAKHVVSLLDEARVILKGQPAYIFVEWTDKTMSPCMMCDKADDCDATNKLFIQKYPCAPKDRPDGKNGYYKKNF